MKARDVMTTDVVTVVAETSVTDIATLLLENGISGVPVLKGYRVVGVVSEGHLVHRPEIGTAHRGESWWLRLFTTETPEEFIKTHSIHARDIMTPDVVTVPENTLISEIADLLDSRRIKRVPVVRDGKLVGIVSRANLVQALAAAGEAVIGPVDTTDETIRARLQETLIKEPWWSAMTSTITVPEGIVPFWGLSARPDEHDAAKVAAKTIAGVRGVTDHRTQPDGRLADL